MFTWSGSTALEALIPKEFLRLLPLTLQRRSSATEGPRRWTLRGLQRWVAEHFGRRYCLETLRRVLHRLGLSWKKARKLLARANPLSRLLFLHQLQSLVAQALEGRIVLCFLDEAHIHCDVDLSYGWGTRGAPLLIHSTSPGLSYKATFYGLYLFPLARVHLWHAPWADTEHTLTVLSRLRQEYPDRRIVLLWDGASYHRSATVRAHAAALDIALVPLPAYSPDFMPVEAVWRWLRQTVTANYCHDSVALLLARVCAFAWDINQDPVALAARLPPKTSLNFSEEELRLSNWN